MKAVRFRKEYTDVPDVRLSYELVSDDEPFEINDNWEVCYNTKLLGLVPKKKMESSEDTDTPAINVFVHLSNIKNVE